MKLRVPVAGIVAGIALFATACGGGGDSDAGSAPVLIHQGSQSVDTADLVTTTVASVDGNAGGAAEGEGGDGGDGVEPVGDDTSATTTLPQNEQSESENIDDLFTAMRTFNSCLEDEGQPFIGFDPNAPDDDPRRSPAYLEALGKCAAVSQIQEALASADLGSEGKTPEEIEERNRGLIGFADCLKGRGWNPQPFEPDENGLLEVGDLGAPEGENLFESADMDDCRRIGTEQAEAEG